MVKVVFDEFCGGWHKHADLNRRYLELQKAFFIDKFLYRGYIYLNEIYEAIGANWDPYKENVCWINTGTGLQIDIERMEDAGTPKNTFLIKIQ